MHGFLFYAVRHLKHSVDLKVGSQDSAAKNIIRQLGGWLSKSSF
jgi:hypothetical protein